MATRNSSNWISTRNANNQEDLSDIISAITSIFAVMFTDESANGGERWQQRSGKLTNPGTVTHPKDTVDNCNLTFSGLAPGNGGTVNIGPGFLSTVLNIMHDVAYIGSGKGITLCNNGLNVLPSLLGFALTSIINMNFINTPVVIDTSGAPGVIFISDGVAFSSGTTFSDPKDGSTMINNINCVYNQGAVFINGGNLTFFNCGFQSNMTIKSSSFIPTVVILTGCAIIGNLIINYNSGDFPVTIFMGTSFLFGSISINGIGICAASSVTFTPPINYSTSTITGTVGFCLIQDNGNTASALVCNNGLTKVSMFAAAAPNNTKQIVTTDISGNGIWDFPFLVVFGGAKVITVMDASTLTPGNALRIASGAGSAAFLPDPAAPLVNGVMFASQFMNNFDFQYNGNQSVALWTVNNGSGGSTTPTDYSYNDPLARFSNVGNAFAKLVLATVGTTQVKFGFTGGIHTSGVSLVDTNATYAFGLVSLNDGSIRDLAILNGLSLTSAQTRATLAGFTIPNRPGPTSDVYTIVLTISGSDGLVHTVTFDDLNFIVEVMNP